MIIKAIGLLLIVEIYPRKHISLRSNAICWIITNAGQIYHQITMIIYIANYLRIYVLFTIRSITDENTKTNRVAYVFRITPSKHVARNRDF